MPPLYVIVGPDWLLKYTPISWKEDSAVNPLLLDVFNKIAQGLGLCLDAEEHEHGSDLMLRQEREGHKFSDVHCFIATIGCLETKFLYL